MRAHHRHRDIFNPGVVWSMLSVESPKQTEFKTHESGRRHMQAFKVEVDRFLETDLVMNEKGWEERIATRIGPDPGLGFEVTIHVIEGG